MWFVMMLIECSCILLKVVVILCECNDELVKVEVFDMGKLW